MSSVSGSARSVSPRRPAALSGFTPPRRVRRQLGKPTKAPGALGLRLLSRPGPVPQPRVPLPPGPPPWVALLVTGPGGGSRPDLTIAPEGPPFQVPHRMSLSVTTPPATGILILDLPMRGLRPRKDWLKQLGTRNTTRI